MSAPTPEVLDWCRRVEELKKERGGDLTGVEFDSPIPTPSWVERVTISTFQDAEFVVEWQAIRTFDDTDVRAVSGFIMYSHDRVFSHGPVVRGQMEDLWPIRIQLDQQWEKPLADAVGLHAALGEVLEHLRQNGAL